MYYERNISKFVIYLVNCLVKCLNFVLEEVHSAKFWNFSLTSTFVSVLFEIVRFFMQEINN